MTFDLTTIIALTGIILGSAGVAGLIKVLVDGRQSARQHDLEVLREVVEQLRDDYDRVSERQKATDEELIKEREARRALSVEFADAKQRERLLRQALEQVELMLGQVQEENGLLKTDLADAQRQIKVLRRELEKAQRHIAELVIENEELRKQVNGEAAA